MFEHRIDPIIGEVAGLYLWYYGLSYTLGFLSVFLWFRRNAARLKFTAAEVYEATIMLALGVLVGGRIVEVIFYEWHYYAKNLHYAPAYWLGGMSTHGILLGAIVAVYGFCRLRGKSFLKVTDELVIPGAFIMGVGRLGNFIDGQIVGAPAEVWWGVVFPDTEGPRHPVVLYDGIKNLLLIPLLLWLRNLRPPIGVITAHFIFWYGFLRIFVDLFREYRVEIFGMGPGQEFNIAMALLGMGLYLWAKRRGKFDDDAETTHKDFVAKPLRWKRAALVGLLLFPLTIPSDWTQDVPARYGKRHPGLSHSVFYPEIPQPTADP